MASSSDVVKKVTRFKLKLTDTADSATVLKILQKLKDLDITVDILAETGIGKTVNSLRRHEQAGEFAKSLVRGWKKLVPKECMSCADDRETMCVKDKLDEQNCPNAGSLTEDLNNNRLTSRRKSQDSSDEAVFKTRSREADLEKHRCEELKGKKNDNQEKSYQVNWNIFQSDVLEKKIEEDKIDDSFVSKKKKNDQSDRKSGDSDILLGNKRSREKLKSNCESGRFVSEKESIKKSKPSKESSKESKEFFSYESGDKYPKMLKLANTKDAGSPGKLWNSEAQKGKRKKTSKERHEGLKHKEESENEGHSKHKNKKAKITHKDQETDGDQEKPSMSFESYLNYDVNVFKRKERCGVKKPAKEIKTAVKAEEAKDSGMKPFKSAVMSINVSPPKQKFQESVMDLLSIPLPAVLPECDNLSSFEYFDRKVEKESDFCDVPEESAVFTGQRFNRKMQVYSGAKTVFLPAMMSLYQQCIRTLQNNIHLLNETGGVPFEILEPVLERCTPEQLLHIEECNPIYIGVTDHLWGKHCQRDFRDSRLQEYESWKEMYIRLFEERERKLQRLTKSIVSAHSLKPKGRQVKMAFIHTVAKPPRDVRIQQEIHGTAVQQPHQPRCSVKAQDNRLRPSCNEPGSSSSGGSNAQDPRKKTRIAPMMAKSLKAFRKRFERR
ncbi:elongin A, like isoform X1 [Lates calcarifer]|uniref:Elongin A, like n=2 Tax=Lates calcarifer TaxID=8187 RepID=A0A4W6DY40_LATCA|nr:elongin A, like isoform X1 [Lates calcarifer]